VTTEAPSRPVEALPVHLSAHCADGEHASCMGTVYVWPPPPPGVDAVFIVRCGCPHCNHQVGGPFM
jgi:hypothetical protein